MVGPVFGKGYYFNSPCQRQGGAEILVFLTFHSAHFIFCVDRCCKKCKVTAR